MPTSPPEPFATTPARIRRRAYVVLGLSMMVAAAAVGWRLAGDHVVQALWVPYPFQTFLDNNFGTCTTCRIYWP
jgi:hypothetical protein